MLGDTSKAKRRKSKPLHQSDETCDLIFWENSTPYTTYGRVLNLSVGSKKKVCVDPSCDSLKKYNVA
jgi:hypothetical protein